MRDERAARTPPSALACAEAIYQALPILEMVRLLFNASIRQRSPSPQNQRAKLRHRVDNMICSHRSEMLGLVDAPGHAAGSGTGVAPHLDVVGAIAHQQRLLGWHAELGE